MYYKSTYTLYTLICLQVKEINVCSNFYKAQNETYRTLLFLQKFEYTPTRNDVTYSTQLSFDRLQMIEELCKLWKGPISFTIYVSDPEFQETMNYIEHSDLLQSRSNIAYHAVFKDGVSNLKLHVVYYVF